MRLLLVAFMLLAFAAPAPAPAQTVSGGGCPLGSSSCNFTVQFYGAKCDGSTDDTTAINAAIAAADAAGGGNVVFPPATCRMNGAMVIPFTGATNPTQNPFRLIGSGGSPDSYLGNSSHGASTPTGGTILDMRYAGGDGSHVAKIDTRGAGILEIEHLTLKDGSTSNTLFIQTTNTTLLIHDNRIVGNTACVLTNCAQDAIRLGGITAASSTLGTNAATAGFQGYGTKIENNQFDFIREAIQYGGSANGTYAANNVVTANSGSGLAQGAPYHFYGVGLGTGGNTIFGGITEVKGYPYAVVFDGTGQNVLNFVSGLGAYDEVMAAPTIGFAYFSATSTLNTIDPGFADSPVQTALMGGPGASANTAVAGGGSSQFPFTVTFGQGSGKATAIINAGNTNSGDGPLFALQWAGATRGGLAGYSAWFGGAVDTRTLLTGFDGLVFATNNAVAGTVSTAQNWTLTGSVTPTGGLAPAGGFAVSPRNIGTCGTAPNSATSAYTAQTPVATEFYVSEVFVPANVTVTGVAVFNSATISGNVKVGLANSSGVNVATSASTAMAGTTSYQRVPFTGTYAAVGPATYYVEVFYDNATVRPNTITQGSCGVTKATSQVFATGFTTIAAPTTFTTALGPVANLY